MDLLSDKTERLLSAILNYRLERHKVIASNIANIDTPDYRSKDLVFASELKARMEDDEGVVMATGSEQHMSDQTIPGEFDEYEVIDSGERVNLEREMAKLSENNLRYNLAVEMLARKFRNLKTVLTEAK